MFGLLLPVWFYFLVFWLSPWRKFWGMLLAVPIFVFCMIGITTLFASFLDMPERAGHIIVLLQFRSLCFQESPGRMLPCQSGCNSLGKPYLRPKSCRCLFNSIRWGAYLYGSRKACLSIGDRHHLYELRLLSATPTFLNPDLLRLFALKIIHQIPEY